MNFSGGDLMHSKEVVTSRKSLEVVQAMRALACTSIFLYHLPERWMVIQTSYSTFILTVFFVFTGYFLIESTRKNDKHYFLKKIIRLIPLYWTLTILLFVVSCLIPSMLGKTYTFSQLIKSFFFIPYYGADGKFFPIVPVGWTLILEVYDYIVFYFLYVLAFKQSKMRDELTLITYLAFVFVIQILKNCFGIINLMVSVFTYKYHYAFAFGLFINMIIHKTKKMDISIFSNTKQVQWCTSILLIVWFAFFSYLINDSWALLSGFIITSIALFFLRNITFPKVLVQLGNMSFSFYLIHRFVIEFTAKITHYFASGIIDELMGVLISYAVTVLISIVLFQIFEVTLTEKLKK